MTHKSLLLALAAALTASTATIAAAQQNFNRIATFAVADNLPADAAKDTATSSEIIAATEDGNILVYSDSPLGAVGFIDISDAKAPKPAGSVKIEGEPTSVTVRGGKVFAGVNTSKSKTEPSGNLSIIDLASKKVEVTCDLGGQPDSVAMNKEGTLLAVAIENERDEDVNEGALTQLPSGDLKIIPIANGAADCAAIRTVELTGLSEVAPEDAEPEFVAFNDAGEIAVTLQENNHIAIVDSATGKVTAHFSAGSVALENVDTKKDGAFNFTGKLDAVPREPDAVKWLGNDRIVVANEGDWKGGTRGFTIFSKTGEVVYEAGASFEYEAANAGHYPDHRNKKGIEPEGLEAARFGDDNLFFVAAERASVIGVYQDAGAAPRFLQLLPSGVGPEGLVAIPGRNLLVTANETDLGEDGLARSHVMIYERREGPATYPMLTAGLTDKGVPLGWGALSGLTADPDKPGTFYAVSDSVYANQPAIYTIDVTQTPAKIVAKTIITRGGNAAQKLDLEGIAADGKGGFWLANEGDSAKLVPHAFLHVDAEGKIDQEIGLPVELLAGQTRFGLEGVTLIGSGDDLQIVGAIQREWKDDPKGQAKLVAYKPETKEWTAARYPLEATDKGWIGLSELVTHDSKLYVLERDNLIGDQAKVKRIYSVALDAFKPAKLDGELPVLEKTLARDVLPNLKSATNGYVVDKLEGFAIDKEGNAFLVTDNDGVDDSSGETLFIGLGDIAATN